MFRRGLQLAPQFPTSEPNDFGFGNVGVMTERQTFGSVGLTSSDTTPETEQSEPFIKLLLAAPRSEEKSELVNRYFSLKSDIETFLEKTRSARLADLTERHNAAVAEVRRTSAAWEAVRLEEFAAQKLFEGLAEKATNARNDLATGQHKLKNLNRALMTRAEVQTEVAHIQTLKAKAVKTADAEGVALNKYHALLAAAGEAGRTHQSAVSVAAVLSSQIDSL